MRNDVPAVTRWFYRQRMEAVLTRSQRPWIVLLDPGCAAPWSGAAGAATRRGGRASKRRRPAPPVIGVQRAAGGRADHPPRRQAALRRRRRLDQETGRRRAARRGGREADPRLPPRRAGLARPAASRWSTSAAKGRPVLAFMTHLNQIGQTGSTPRHPKGSPPAATARSRTSSAGASSTSAAPSTSIRTAAGRAARLTCSTSPTPSPSCGKLIEFWADDSTGGRKVFQEDVR